MTKIGETMHGDNVRMTQENEMTQLTDMQIVVAMRRLQHLMPDPRSLTALDVAERHAHGMATDEELRSAWPAARDAAWAAVRAATVGGE
jgi:hypothetical protein